MGSQRVELDKSVVDASIKLALRGTDGIEDFCDKRQPYLVLRVRGHAASWLVKTRESSIKIGNVVPPTKAGKLPERRKRTSKSGDAYLGLRDAREKAKLEWAKLGNRPEGVPEERPFWTWGQAMENYKQYLSQMREDSTGRPIYPSKETQNDVRQIFARPAVAKHATKPLTELNEGWLEEVLGELHAAHGFDAYRKCRAYVVATLNLANDFTRRESGLDGRQWWLMAQRRRRTPNEVAAKIERTKKLAKKKDSFKVEHLGKMLAQHERFCLSRTGNKRISPSVRWGFWWDCLTGHRRGSGTWIAYEDIKFEHPQLDGWGLATWQPEVMKSQHAFTLPIPPLGLHIVRCCLRDFKEAAERAHMKNLNSPWVFTSRVLQSNAGIIPASGSAFANHIRSMRGLRQGNHRDILHGIPDFSMHLLRSTMGDFFLENTDLPDGTASLMIGHEIPGDHRGELDRVGQTGKRWYFQAQRIPEKTKGMALWSETLLEAFYKAGGSYPT